MKYYFFFSIFFLIFYIIMGSRRGINHNISVLPVRESLPIFALYRKIMQHNRIWVLIICV